MYSEALLRLAEQRSARLDTHPVPPYPPSMGNPNATPTYSEALLRLAEQRSALLDP